MAKENDTNMHTRTEKVMRGTLPSKRLVFLGKPRKKSSALSASRPSFHTKYSYCLYPCMYVYSALSGIEGSCDLHAGGGSPVGRRLARVLHGQGLCFRHRALWQALQQLHG